MSDQNRRPETTPPEVTRLLGFVDDANSIARDAFAVGNDALGVEDLSVAAHYLQAAQAMQRLHDVSAKD